MFSKMSKTVIGVAATLTQQNIYIDMPIHTATPTAKSHSISWQSVNRKNFLRRRKL